MKVIPPCNSLSVAQKVKRLVNSLNTDGRLCGQANWYSFDNCREQGFVLRVRRISTFTSLNLAVSENRNSDEIVVYYYHDTAFPTNLPAKDEDWANRKYFVCGDYKGAAKYILTLASEYID